jgi:Citrate synthase, C-terminal domain/Transposase
MDATQQIVATDTTRLDGVRVIGVDEHRWSHARRPGEDGYVTVVIDLTPVLEGTGRARLLDLVPGRSAAALKSWLADQSQAAALEQAALAELRERRPDRAIETNVEFWAAVILDFAEVPTLMMPAMFTCGRTAGWCAHILEQKRLGKLVRPAAIYTGPAPRSPESVEGWDHIAPTP